MSVSDWNRRIIEEFRANHGEVGGSFAGAPMVLVHHRGRTSGNEYVNPLVYMPDDADAETIFIFASKAGAPDHPQWYRNLVAAGEARVEVGDDTYAVSVEELEGERRDRIFDEQARRHPGFADYAKKTEGIRTIPVLALRHRS